MSVEKIAEPFPARALYLPYLVLAIGAILLLVGLLLFFLSPLFIPAIVIGGIGLFALISLGIHYAVYRQEWKATRALSEIESLLVGLDPTDPYGVGRSAHCYYPKLPLEKIPEVFEKLNERIKQAGQTGVMTICKKTASNLGYLINWFIYWSEAEKDANKEQLTFQVNFQNQLLVLFKTALTFYANHPAATDMGLKSAKWFHTNKLIKLMNGIFVFHRNDWFIVPLDTVIDILILEFSLLPPHLVHYRNITILALHAFCEHSLEEHINTARSLPDSLKIIALQDENVKKSFEQAQKKVFLELKKLFDNNQIPSDQVTDVEQLFKKMPEKDPSFAALLTAPSLPSSSSSSSSSPTNPISPPTKQ